jgi:hypothetical protein
MRTASLVLLAACAAVGVGCKTGSKKFDLRAPHVEEFVPPPNENRYNLPPEKGYTPPPPSKEFRPGPGAMQGLGGPGGPGGPGR